MNLICRTIEYRVLNMDESSMVELAWEKSRTWQDAEFNNFVYHYPGSSYEARREFVRYFLMFKSAHSNRLNSIQQNKFIQLVPVNDFDYYENKVTEIDNKFPIYDDYEHEDFEKIILKSYIKYREDYFKQIQYLDSSSLAKHFDKVNGDFAKNKEYYKKERLGWKFYIALDLIKNKLFDGYDINTIRHLDNSIPSLGMSGQLMNKYFSPNILNIHPLLIEYYENRLPKFDGPTEYSIKKQLLKLKGDHGPIHECWRLNGRLFDDKDTINVLTKILARKFLIKRSKEVTTPVYVVEAIEMLEEVMEEDNSLDGDRYRVAHMIDLTYVFFKRLAENKNHELWKKIHGSNPIGFIISKAMGLLQSAWFFAYQKNKDCPNLDKGRWCAYIRFILPLRETFEILNNERRYSESNLAYNDFSLRQGLKAAGILYWDITKAVAIIIALRGLPTMATTAARVFSASAKVANNIYFTLKVFGIKEGVLMLSRSGYAFYVVNAYTINDYIVQGTQFVIEEASGDQLFGPSIGDTTEIVQEIKIGKKIFLRRSSFSVDQVENIAEKKIQKMIRVRSVKTDNADNINKELNALSPQKWLATPHLIKRFETIFDNLTPTKLRGTRFNSWYPDVLVGTSRDSMRNAAQTIITADTSHPLRKLLGNDGKFLSGALKEGETVAKFEMDFRIMQMGHMRSNRAGGEEIVVLMSAFQNQKASRFQERGDIAEVAFDEILIIGKTDGHIGIGVHKGTANDWLLKNIITKEALDNAELIRLEPP